jgi:hypothetical protein
MAAMATSVARDLNSLKPPQPWKLDHSLNPLQSNAKLLLLNHRLAGKKAGLIA